MINFDLISCDVSQDARASIRGFRLLREQPFFIDIERAVYVDGQEKVYIVWADCGNQFRNQWFLGYLLIELAESAKINGEYCFRL